MPSSSLTVGDPMSVILQTVFSGRLTVPIANSAFIVLLIASQDFCKLFFDTWDDFVVQDTRRRVR